MDELKQTMLDILTQWINIPSVNPGDAPLCASPDFGEDRYLRQVERDLASLGFQSVYEPVLEGRNNLFLYLGEPDLDRVDLLLQTHSDVVPAGNMPDAFRPFVKDGRLYGRGSCDAKGQFCAMLWGLLLARQQSPYKAKRVGLSLCCDEEHKHRGVDALVRKKPAAVQGIIVGEPTELALASACKGSIRFCIKTTGKTAHTSMPQSGKNAIYLMARVIRAIETKLAPRIFAKSCRLCGNATIAVSLIEGGTAVNAVPDSCTIHLDRRLIPGESWKEAYEEVRQVILENLETPEREYLLFEEPYLVDPSYRSTLETAFSKEVPRVLRQHGLSPELVGLAFGCDASKLAGWDVPVFVFGPGSIRQAHTENEYLSLRELEKAAHVYKSIILSAIK